MAISLATPKTKNDYSSNDSLNLTDSKINNNENNDGNSSNYNINNRNGSNNNNDSNNCNDNTVKLA